MPSSLSFLDGGGDMGQAIRAFAWSASPLPAAQDWPPSLKTLVALMLASGQPMFIAWGEARTLIYNDAYAPLLGNKHPGALGRPFFEVWAEAGDDLLPLDRTVFAGGSVHGTDIALILDRGCGPEEAHFAFSYTPVRDEYGTVAGLFCACTETTQAVLAREKDEQDRRRLAQMFDQAPSFIAMLQGPQHRIAFANAAYLRLIGPRDVLGKTVAEALPDAVAQGYLALLDDVFTTGQAIRSAGARYLVDAADGGPAREHFVDFIFQPLTDALGRVNAIFVEGADVTERSRGEAALRESERQLREANATLEQRVTERTAALQASQARLRTIFETSYQLQGLLAPDGTVLDANATSLAVIDATLDDVIGKPFWEAAWFSSTPGVPDRVREGVGLVAAGGQWRHEMSTFGPRGLRSFDFSMRPIRDADGAVIAIVPEAVDITERRQTEEALRQSQKLEAMGQLTGGVAHDFNNLLTPILGGLDMLNRRGLGGEREQRLIAGALQSADRAKTLVQRLLAFARRQPLQPVSVDVASLVTGMADLIASTSGPKIHVVVAVGEDLPPANADPNQLEMAILNLSVNARDAMPQGGTLRITATSEPVLAGNGAGLLPGPYVRLSVADTGTGMDEATLARAVEPFFSTKGVGRGTGLGLSMVHGLASQLGGALSLSSKPGLGTNVELWLPVSASPARLSVAAASTADGSAVIGTALLVDDEDIVRMSTAEMLSELGFAVLEAASAEEALRTIDAGVHIDMLVTDHLMPGMTGVDLAYAVRARLPQTPVLIVSGFADAEGITADLPRLTKPFRRAELAASVSGITSLLGR